MNEAPPQAPELSPSSQVPEALTLVWEPWRWGSGNRGLSKRKGGARQAPAFTWHLLCTQSSGEAEHWWGDPGRDTLTPAHTLQSISTQAQGGGLLPRRSFSEPHNSLPAFVSAVPPPPPTPASTTPRRLSVPEFLFLRRAEASNQTLGKQFSISNCKH